MTLSLSLSSPDSTTPEGLPRVVVSFSSPLLTLYLLLLFSFLTPPTHVLVCHTHHFQQQSVTLFFFFSLSPSSPVVHVTVVADRQFHTIGVSLATLFMAVFFCLALSLQGCFWKNRELWIGRDHTEIAHPLTHGNHHIMFLLLSNTFLNSIKQVFKCFQSTCVWQRLYACLYSHSYVHPCLHVSHVFLISLANTRNRQRQ